MVQGNCSRRDCKIASANVQKKNKRLRLTEEKSERMKAYF